MKSAYDVGALPSLSRKPPSRLNNRQAQNDRQARPEPSPALMVTSATANDSVSREPEAVQGTQCCNRRLGAGCWCDPVEPSARSAQERPRHIPSIPSPDKKIEMQVLILLLGSTRLLGRSA